MHNLVQPVTIFLPYLLAMLDNDNPIFSFTDADTSRSVWWHYLLINVPDDIQYTDHALLWITGGDNTDG